LLVPLSVKDLLGVVARHVDVWLFLFLFIELGDPLDSLSLFRIADLDLASGGAYLLIFVSHSISCLRVGDPLVDDFALDKKTLRYLKFEVEEPSLSSSWVFVELVATSDGLETTHQWINCEICRSYVIDEMILDVEEVENFEDFLL